MEGGSCSQLEKHISMFTKNKCCIDFCAQLLFLSLTLGAHAQRGLRYLVCVSVCVSVTQHLTFHVIIRATNDTTFLAADEGRKF